MVEVYNKVVSYRISSQIIKQCTYLKITNFCTISVLQIALDHINAFIIASKTTTANYKRVCKVEQSRRLSTENFQK